MDEVHLEQLEDQEDKVRQDQRASLAVLVDPGNKVGREDLDFLDQRVLLDFLARLVLLVSMEGMDLQDFWDLREPQGCLVQLDSQEEPE